MSNSIINETNSFFLEDFNLSEIAEEIGTPCYVYSKKQISENYTRLSHALKGLDHLICFAVKANSNLSILKLFSDFGAGFDIVSGGELLRVQSIGADFNKVVFSGVGKSKDEILIGLQNSIHCFNIESEQELLFVNQIAKDQNLIANISIRVNPNVDAKTHPYISTGLKENKFGIDQLDAIKIYKQAASLSNISIKGIDCHIGSQIISFQSFNDAFKIIAELIRQLESENIFIEHIDIGGGIGISYEDETIPSLIDYADIIRNTLGVFNKKIILEPGRLLIGNAGLLLTKVQFIKENQLKSFAIVDSAMNDLMRPSLYNAYHRIINLTSSDSDQNSTKKFDIVGPICETGDFLGKDRTMNLKQNDLLAILDCGAYGFSMSSNYNTRPRVAEVMVDGDSYSIIRHRESFDDLIKNELSCLSQK